MCSISMIVASRRHPRFIAARRAMCPSEPLDQSGRDRSLGRVRAAILLHRMRVAPQLRPDGSRERGVRLIELKTTATFYNSTPGVYFHTTFTNTARDHRMRVHLRTGIATGEFIADSTAGFLTRQTAPDIFYPVQSTAAVVDKTEAIAAIIQGLPEFETLQENGQTTLAL